MPCPFKLPVSIDKVGLDIYLVDATCELVSKMEAITEEEINYIVKALNNYKEEE